MHRTGTAALLLCLAVGCGGVSVDARGSGSSSTGASGNTGGSAGASAGSGGTTSSAGGATAGSAGVPGNAGPAPGDVQSGQRIFDYGTGPDGQPIPRTGGVGMGMMNSCASCHGVDGHGRNTMMFDAPDITYGNLTDPAGMVEPDGTRGEPYIDALIRRAVVDGIGADGDKLDTAMPRWQLDEQEWADLLSYLETLK